MAVEDTLPELFRIVAYHPSLYIYAWRRKDLEKLFDELMKSNVAVVKGEAWLVNEQIEALIPLKSGDIQPFYWQAKPDENEEWYDFVERSAKESLSIINQLNLEKNVRLDLSDKIWYHFTFAEGK